MVKRDESTARLSIKIYHSMYSMALTKVGATSNKKRVSEDGTGSRSPSKDVGDVGVPPHLLSRLRGTSTSASCYI